MDTAGGNLDCICRIARDVAIDATLQSATKGLEFRHLSGLTVKEAEIVGSGGIKDKEFSTFRADLRKGLKATI